MGGWEGFRHGIVDDIPDSVMSCRGERTALKQRVASLESRITAAIAEHKEAQLAEKLAAKQALLPRPRGGLL